MSDLTVGYTEVRIDDEGGRHWRSAISHYLRQQAGNSLVGSDLPGKTNLRLHDLASLPRMPSSATEIVPRYLQSAEGVVYHQPMELGLRPTDRGLEVWCGPRRRNFSLSFLLQMCLATHGGTLVHAAAVSRDGGAILVPGFGGVGKTAFVASAMAVPGVRLFGDDLVCIGPQGAIHSYLRPFALYPHHRRLFPEYFQARRVLYARVPAMPLKAAQLLVNRVGRRLNLPYVPLPENVAQAGYLRVPPEALFSQAKLADGPLPLQSVFLLARSESVDAVTVAELDPGWASSFMTNVIYHEHNRFADVLFSWLAIRGIAPDDHFRAVSKTLLTALESAEGVYRVLVPARMEIEQVGASLVDIVFGSVK